MVAFRYCHGSWLCDDVTLDPARMVTRLLLSLHPPYPCVWAHGIRFHLNYKTPPGVIKYRERHTPESTPAFFEVTSPKGAMLLLCLSVLDHSVEVFTNFAGHTFACSILQLNL